METCKECGHDLYDGYCVNANCFYYNHEQCEEDIYTPVIDEYEVEGDDEYYPTDKEDDNDMEEEEEGNTEDCYDEDSRDMS